MFALIWSNVAMDLLADAYVSATAEERERTTGIDALNARLRSDPLAEGESRSGDFRVTFTSLLSVAFRVDTHNRVVRVTGVGRYGK